MKYPKVLPKGPFAQASMCKVCQRNPKQCNSDRAECSHVDCPYRSKAWGVPTPPHEPLYDEDRI